MSTTQTHYTLRPPVNAGTYYQQLGWAIIDTQATSADFRIIATGDEKGMRSYARALNARDRAA